ncbi:MAG: Holliday junction branch migration protein RuvA [Bacteroidota bacterium]
MIAFVSGNITELEATHVIVEAGGIGYWIKISLNTYGELQGKKQTKLHTHFMVREDSQQLFGFTTIKEKQLFEQLISISGVGGNTALMILSSLSAEDLYQAIKQENAMVLKKVKGIGAKTAGRIILELKDKIKLDNLSGGTGSVMAGGNSMKKQEALTALVNLGLNKSAMNQRIDKILKEKGETVTVEEIIKLALRNPG